MPNYRGTIQICFILWQNLLNRVSTPQFQPNKHAFHWSFLSRDLTSQNGRRNIVVWYCVLVYSFFDQWRPKWFVTTARQKRCILYFQVRRLFCLYVTWKPIADRVLNGLPVIRHCKASLATDDAFDGELLTITILRFETYLCTVLECKG